MNDTVREVVGYGLPIAWITALLALSGELSPVGRFLGATVGLLLSIKAGSWVLLGARSREFSLSPLQTLLFWTLWPGVRPDLFAGADGCDVPTDRGTSGDRHEPDDRDVPTDRHEPDDSCAPDGRTFVEGYGYVMVGLVLAVVSVLALPVVGGDVSSWLLLFAVLSVVHFGVGRLLPFGLRWLGYPVPPLFDEPLRSDSVGEFWSEAWNRPFVNMNRLFLTRPLSSRIGMGGAAFLAFLVSGLLHELAISYPAGGGWGTPLLYFVVQGALYAAEQTVFPNDEVGGEPALGQRVFGRSTFGQRVLGRSALGRRVLGRLWTYAAVLVPLPLLFHAPFRTTFLVPLVEGGHSLLLAHPLSAYVGAGLWIGAAGHFLVLAASFRVPEELDWDADLASLQPLNRKLMWTYGGFIVMTIVAFGVLTALFHEQFVSGTPVALGLCGTIAVFWTARILVDAFYFSHDDWPDGLEFVVGHTMLTSLFVLLVVIYGGTIVSHVF